MKIASSALQLESSHSKQQRHEIRESLRAWVDDPQPLQASANGRQSNAGVVQLSDAGKAAQSSEAAAIREGIEDVENDPMLALIRAMLAILTGREAQVFDAGELNLDALPAATANPDQAAQAQTAQRPVSSGAEYVRHESYSESEQTQFEAAGVVHTTDGKEINFTLSLSMTRSYHEESDVSIRVGDVRRVKDPLVLNFNGAAAQLTSQRFAFDLDADGQSEDINFVAGGSGFLALDRNGDGKINNGSELFGAKSGDGFAELSTLDDDGNGWIDENDAAYQQLRVWTKDGAGNDQLSTLKQANVGALALARVQTPFDRKDGSNALLGQIRASGLFLREDGGAGTMQQVDLTI